MTATAPAQEYQELERLYTQDPASYRSRVRRMIWLGYGYVASCLLVIVGFLAGGIALFASGILRFGFIDEFLQIGIPAVAVAGMMIRAVFVRIPAPEGHYLDGELKQAVLDFVEPVRQATGGCRVDDVIIVDDLNAAVQQRPKWGLFGPSTNSLLLGAPLLHVMSPDEVRAVIAHEFGHLSNAHGRMGASVYRLDHTLRHAAHAISQKAHSGIAEWGFKFFNWFYPRFDTITFALRRGQEYEADRVAAAATSPAAIASSLCRLHAVRDAWADYWRNVWSNTREQADNRSLQPYRRLSADLPRMFDSDVARGAVDAALERETGFEDTHPALKDRLGALEVSAVHSGLPTTSALEEIFAPAQRDGLLDRLDAGWQTESSDAWSEGHQEYLDAQQARAALAADRENLDEAGLLRLARLEESLEGSDAALDSIRSAAERFPESAEARFQLGRLLFRTDFAAAERAFVESVERDVEWLPDAQRYIEHRYDEEGRSLDESPIAPFLERHKEIVALANAERESVNVGDAFFAPPLCDEERARLLECLAGYPEIRSLDLVEKEAEHFSENRLFVLGLTVNTMHDNVEVKEGKWLARVPPILVDALPSPNSFFTILLSKQHPWIATFESVAGARVYEREVSTGRRIWETLKVVYRFAALGIFVIAIGYLAWAWWMA